MLDSLDLRKKKETNLGLLCQSPKGAESIVQCLLVHVRIQISHEQISPNIYLLLVVRCFVDSDGFSIQFYLVHDLNSILGIRFRHEFAETKSLVSLGDSVFRKENVGC